MSLGSGNHFLVPDEIPIARERKGDPYISANVFTIYGPAPFKLHLPNLTVSFAIENKIHTAVIYGKKDIVPLLKCKGDYGVAIYHLTDLSSEFFSHLGALWYSVTITALTVLGDLRSPPGNRLEALAGDRADQHSIRVNGQFRICFRWVDGDADDVEFTDYH